MPLFEPNCREKLLSKGKFGGLVAAIRWRPMHLQTTLTASLLAAVMTAAFAAPSQANVLINIDKSAQVMTVSVDGQQRYVWPVSTGRAGYDTPNGTFKPNRMDADHQSQEWDNAPMPHTIFFDLRGHAIHGFFDVKHLGMPVSHGCVRLSPTNASTLFSLVKAEGMSATTVTVSGHIPSSGAPAVARRRAPAVDTEMAAPVQLAPRYGQYDQSYRGQYDYRGSYAQQGYPSYYAPPQPPPVYQPQFFRPFSSY
jgi:hypothetical protein